MDGSAVPGLNYTPADLRGGWKALLRDGDEPDWWWDGNRWLELEAKTDLSAYRTAAQQDELDALFAPKHSPVFTGIPQVPTPDYTIPQQAVPVSELKCLLETVNDILYGKRRIT
jgi:hypothetical protein